MEIQSTFKIGAREIVIPALDDLTLLHICRRLEGKVRDGNRADRADIADAILLALKQDDPLITLDELDELDDETAFAIIENLAAQMQMAVAARKAGSAGTRH